METIRSYTSLEQSKVLAKILPLESADMCWYIDDNNIPTHTPDNGFYKQIQDKNHIPCWSLAALLGVLPNYQLQTQDDRTRILCSCNGMFNFVTEDNPVDACYEMIIKLSELKLL